MLLNNLMVFFFWQKCSMYATTRAGSILKIYAKLLKVAIFVSEYVAQINGNYVPYLTLSYILGWDNTLFCNCVMYIFNASERFAGFFNLILVFAYNWFFIKVYIINQNGYRSYCFTWFFKLFLFLNNGATFFKTDEFYYWKSVLLWLLATTQIWTLKMR